MSKQQNQFELNELIIASGVFQAIDLLHAKLNIYQGSKIADKYCYEICVEFLRVQGELSKLEYQLRDLIDQSVTWEMTE